MFFFVCGEELRDIRVGTSIGHGEHARAFVGALEVLIGELLAVDGLATSALLKKPKESELLVF